MGHIENERCGESCPHYYIGKNTKLQGGDHMIYITGDPHGDFRNIARFCKKMQTSKEDVLIILGDAGINYYGSEQDKRKKKCNRPAKARPQKDKRHPTQNRVPHFVMQSFPE